jgi:hypothetical protein
MGLLNKNGVECTQLRAQLEHAASAAPDARNLAQLLQFLPVPLQQHGEACAECREAIQNLLTTRAALSSLASSAILAGPWFPSRVMAAIAQRKAELARVADTWTFLPRLAAHLTWASSVALLLASAWLYQKPATVPAQTSTRAAVATDITGEPVVDSSTLPSSNDVLVSLAEKKPQ